MADVVITLRIMLDIKANMALIENNIKEKIHGFSGAAEFRTSIQEIAFGIKALNIKFLMDENKGTTEPLEKEIQKIKGISSVEVTDVRRAIG